MTYREIREKYQNLSYDGVTIVDLYSTMISPFITKYLIKTKITPNETTILMILSGIIGAIFFMIPNIYVKIIGVVFIHLWYIFDCCDGEVARIKKKYSTFGKELDYTAHIVNHPLFNIAFALSMISLNRYNSTLIVFGFMLLMGLDMVGRQLVSFEVIYELKTESQGNIIKVPSSKKKKILLSIVHFFDCFPNFALIFPIVFIIDYFLNVNFAVFYLIIQLIILCILILRLAYRWIIRIKDL